MTYTRVMVISPMAHFEALWCAFVSSCRVELHDCNIVANFDDCYGQLISRFDDPATDELLDFDMAPRVRRCLQLRFDRANSTALRPFYVTAYLFWAAALRKNK